MDVSWAIALAALIGIAGYVLNSWLQSRRARFARKEERYMGMIKAIPGFLSGKMEVVWEARELKQRFITEFNLAWLYAPDEVVKYANQFLATTVKGKSPRLPR